jgi:hypothetical protein
MKDLAAETRSGERERNAERESRTGRREEIVDRMCGTPQTPECSGRTAEAQKIPYQANERSSSAIFSSDKLDGKDRSVSLYL